MSALEHGPLTLWRWQKCAIRTSPGSVVTRQWVGRSALVIPSGYDVYGLLDIDEDRVSEDVLLEAIAPADGAVVSRLARPRPRPPQAGDEHVLYSGWRYRFRQVHAAALRGLPADGEGGFPDLLFPLDRFCGPDLAVLWTTRGEASAPAALSPTRSNVVCPRIEPIDAATPIAATGREIH